VWDIVVEFASLYFKRIGISRLLLYLYNYFKRSLDWKVPLSHRSSLFNECLLNGFDEDERRE
jgi:hypothetical protein